MLQSVDSWKQRPVALSAPEFVEVEKFARALEKPEPKLLRDNSLVSPVILIDI